MTLKKIKRVLGIDFETASHQRASACSVGLYLKDFNSSVLHEEEILINPECNFDYFCSLVNGITPDTVKDALAFPSAASVISSLIDENTVVVAHNASFDMSVYRRSCTRYNIQMPSFEYLCTYIMAKNIIPGLPSYSLDYVTDTLSLPAFSHHNALADAGAAVALFERLMTEIQCVSPGQLVRHCGVVSGYVFSADEYAPCHKSSVSKRSISLPDASEDIDIEHIPQNENSPLFGKVVVFTGTLSSASRAEAFQQLRNIGGIPADNLTKKTNYLVYGYQDPFFLNGKEKSSKLIKAETYISKGADLQIISEAEYERLFDC